MFKYFVLVITAVLYLGYTTKLTNTPQHIILYPFCIASTNQPKQINQQWYKLNSSALLVSYFD